MSQMATPCCNAPMSRAEWEKNVEEGDCSVCGEKILTETVNLTKWGEELLEASKDPDLDSDNFVTETRSFLEEFIAQNKEN